MKFFKSLVVLVFVIMCATGCGKKSGLEGKIVDGKGQPIANVKVIASQLPPIIKNYEQFETTTDSNGMFHFGKLFPSAKYSLITWDDTWANMPMMTLEYEPSKLHAQFYKGGWITDQKMIVQSGPEGETILLPAPMTIKQAVTTTEGIIVNGNGQPYANLKVMVKQVNPLKGYEYFETMTDSFGLFRFEKLCPNSQYDLIAQKDDLYSLKIPLKTSLDEKFDKITSPIMFRYLVSNEGVIADSRTGLEWVVGPDRDTSYMQAKQWITACSLAGGGWRMPTLQELRTLYQKGIGERNIDPAFNLKTNFYFWGEYIWAESNTSSSPWSFRFHDGDQSSNRYTNDGRVFGVRSCKILSKLGAIRIYSKPEGAKVSIDRKQVGITPLFMSDIAIGSHVLRLEYLGCSPVERNIMLRSGEVADIGTVSLQCSLSIEIPRSKTFDIDSEFVYNEINGKLFVITGKVRNDSPIACGFIQVTGKIFNNDKSLIKTETVFCGNILHHTDLVNVDLSTLQKRLQNRSEDSRSNETVLPGASIPFMIVFSDLPVNLDEFSIEVTNIEAVDPLSTKLDSIKNKVEKAQTETVKSPPIKDTFRNASDNVVSSNGNGGGGGNSSLAIDAINSYRLQISGLIENNWKFDKSHIDGRNDLVSVLVIKIKNDGKISDIWFEKKSGNGYFDDSVLKAVKKSILLPPLPREYSQQYCEMGLIFTPNGLKHR